MREIWHSFRAMNTDVRSVVVVEADETPDAEQAIREVETVFATVEDALSRFRPESELSRLNRASVDRASYQSGAPFQASPLLFTVAVVALEAARETRGLFDPTVLGALVVAGYDRSFEDLPIERPRAATSPWKTRPRWDAVTLDPVSRTISLPPGLGLDLGGIGKGWAVDRAIERLRRFSGFGIDAGGDLYCHGKQADGRPWTVGVEDPRSPGRDVWILSVDDHAVATSSVTRRRWLSAGRQNHHLIDPRTGQPAETDVLSATVIAGSVARAETLTKAALLLGSEAGVRFLNQYPNTAGILVRSDGRVLRSAGFSERQLCVDG